MAFIISAFIFSVLLKKSVALNQNILYKAEESSVDYGSFQPYFYQYLSAKKINTSSIKDELDCPFRCIGEPKCLSFNIAAYADAKGFYLCELLATEKFGTKDKIQFNASFHHYSPSTCQQPLCRNNGTCIRNFELNSFRCDCHPGFVGVHCERKGKTCSEIKSHSSRAMNGSYIIDPDDEGGYELFTVFCDMTNKNRVGVTVISHDSETRMLVNGYEENGSYVRRVNYSGVGLTSVPQLAGLLDVSAHCEQFVKYECYNTALMYMGNPAGWWVSRDMVKMTYWGGATPADSYKCACGVTSPNTCADTTRGCNCDKNDNAWREDSGLLSEKSHLPDLKLRFGDSGSPEE